MSGRKQGDIRVLVRPLSRWAESVRAEIAGLVDHSGAGQAEVLAELPLGVMERENPTGLREAWGYVEGEFLRFHFCAKCGGWVKGWPVEGHVNDLALLAGRRGYTYKCARCGGEIAFYGAVA